MTSNNKKRSRNDGRAYHAMESMVEPSMRWSRWSSLACGGVVRRAETETQLLASTYLLKTHHPTPNWESQTCGDGGGASGENFLIARENGQKEGESYASKCWLLDSVDYSRRKPITKPVQVACLTQPEQRSLRSAEILHFPTLCHTSGARFKQATPPPMPQLTSVQDGC